MKATDEKKDVHRGRSATTSETGKKASKIEDGEDVNVLRRHVKDQLFSTKVAVPV